MQSVCLQGCAQLCSPALPVNRGCSPHGDVALCSEAGWVMLETEIGMKRFFYLWLFYVWKLWKLRGGVDGGGLGCICGKLVVPHPPI